MTMTQKHDPRKFQLETEYAILNGNDVVLQAPTGSGKTRAVIRPALKGFERDYLSHPQKLIYGAPMRTLVSSQMAEMEDVARRNPKWRDHDWFPTIQTGDRPEDTLFEGKLVFATVDQMLASFLNVPYNVPNRLNNINAGAFIGSYLIFDEFHLYPSRQMLLSVLAMCRMLKDVSRFTLMTATFSRELLDAVSVALDATSIADAPGVAVTDGLFSDIEHLHTQERTWQVGDGPLSAGHIRAALDEQRTVLCVLNRVDRAQEVYRDLLVDGTLPTDVDVTLLHSRFYREDRRRKEGQVTKWLGKTPEDGNRRKVVIATQVVEVGLDISADVLLTECAPAANLIQRAGRCARWGQAGTVVVFQPPDYPADHKTYPGQPNYAPYEEDGLRDVCEQTWAALASSDFDEHILRYHDEQRLIDLTHSAHDREHLIDGLDGRIERRIGEIVDCMRYREAGLINRLIRENTGVPLYIGTELEGETLTEKPYQLESFNVSRGRIAFAMEEMDTANVHAPFYFAAGLEEKADDSDDTQTRIITKWQALGGPDDVYSYHQFVAHPQAVAYTPETGLVWLNLDREPAKCSPKKPARAYQRHTYHRDTFVEHTTALRIAYGVQQGVTRKQPLLRNEYAYALTRVVARLGLDTTYEKIDRYLRLTIALHDVGKLNRPWQTWAGAHQTLFGEMVETATQWDGSPLAHTDTTFPVDVDETLFREKLHQRHKQPRGPHAVESAEAARPLVEAVTGGTDLWFNVIIAAICHHHTPTANTCGAFAMVPNGPAAIHESLVACGFAEEAADWTARVQQQFDESDLDVEDACDDILPSRTAYIPSLMYYLFVRVLRLADQRSFDYVTQKGR